MSEEVVRLSQRLIVIGNGFDLHHGIPSMYSAFGEYVRYVDRSLYDIVDKYLGIDEDFWYQLETRLAYFDSDQVIDHAQNFLVPYSADDWSDAYHHDFEYEIEQIVVPLSKGLRQRFSEWIRNLPIANLANVPLVRCVDLYSSIINFNYTPTLQAIYGVPRSSVLHIHGSSLEPEAELVLGHGWERQANDRLSWQVDEDTDTRVAGGYAMIDDYFEKTFKPTEAIISKNRFFFDNLKFVKEVFVLGHSMADVDSRYFREILAKVQPTATWTVSYHSNMDEPWSRVRQLGVPEGQIRLLKLSAL